MTLHPGVYVLINLAGSDVTANIGIFAFVFADVPLTRRLVLAPGSRTTTAANVRCTVLRKTAGVLDRASSTAQDPLPCVGVSDS